MITRKKTSKLFNFLLLFAKRDKRYLSLICVMGSYTDRHVQCQLLSPFFSQKKVGAPVHDVISLCRIIYSVFPWCLRNPTQCCQVDDLKWNVGTWWILCCFHDKLWILRAPEWISLLEAREVRIITFSNNILE